ncbi:MAG: HD domain-containing protein [candidate division Zixibacteria bacterium]
MQEILREGHIYEVGGCVRDSLMNRKVDMKDLDYLVTGIPFQRLRQLMLKHGRVDLVGRSFGVIKFTPCQKSMLSEVPVTYDVSLPRAEISTGPAHTDFDVDFNPDLPVEKDLLRRDFSINAMARSLADGSIIDPFGGQIDIEKKIIRVVSENSFNDDPLRMLRAVQFAARFEFEIETSTFQSLKDNAHLIESVSPERIAEELNKIFLRAEKPSIGLRLMEMSGLLEFIIPELLPAMGCEQPGGFHAYDVFEHTLHIVDACPPRLALRLAALFHDITKPKHKRVTDSGATFYGHEGTGANVAQKVMKRLRYSNDLIKDVALLVDRHMFTTEVGPKGLRRFIRRIGQRLIPDLLDLRRADVIAQGMGGTIEDVDEMEQAIKEEIKRKPPFGRSDLKIDGNDLQCVFGMDESPVIGEVIDYLLEKVLDNPEDNTSEILLNYAREYLENK